MNNIVDIKEIIADPNQPRKYFGVERMASLKDSIKKHGIITPLTVQKDKGGKYLLIDGERRFRSAKDLGLKEVPVYVVSPKDPFSRLLEQFHIQEQHEEWNEGEKAAAILEISEISKKPLKDVCELLSIDPKQIRYYLAFAELQNKDRFIGQKCNLWNSKEIGSLKTVTKKIKEDLLEETFSKSDENRLEKVLIDKIGNKEITSNREYVRIKDSFRNNPKMIDKFIKGEIEEIDDMYVGSGAKGASYIRNMTVQMNYVIQNGAAFLKDPNVALNATEIHLLERTIDVCEKVLSLTGKKK